MERLPPLNPLRAFEAAGRLRSIRKAAEELFVTPGAVSRQVQSLERWLGTPLFRREPREMVLVHGGGVGRVGGTGAVV
jgi:LysR family glycine cleavage system transcriptional activator